MLRSEGEVSDFLAEAVIFTRKAVIFTEGPVFQACSAESPDSR